MIYKEVESIRDMKERQSESWGQQRERGEERKRGERENLCLSSLKFNPFLNHTQDTFQSSQY